MISPHIRPGGPGNHVWQYAVCRTVAEYNNYEFHIPREHFVGTTMFDLDMGVEQDLTTKFFQVDNWDSIQKYNPNVFKVEDFTKISGHMQSERYVIQNRKNIKKWMKLKSESTDLYNHLNMDNNTCIIHVRANDLKMNPECLLPKKYYDDSIRHMKQINPNMRFFVLTDDVEFAKGYFHPDYFVYQHSMVEDLYLLNHARYLIISASTYAWWAAWLNDNSIVTIAPKYWLHYNRSKGHWALADIITNGWLYVDRDGNLSTSNQCLTESRDDLVARNYGCTVRA